jgi:hypothetical protein
MRSPGRAFGLGILVWLVPFVVSFLVFPFHDSWRALFESVMAVAVSAVAVWFGLLYLRRLPAPGLMDGVLIGLLWWLMCVAIDLPLVSAGPMEMTLVEYLADIGLTYVTIPVITAGLGAAYGSSGGREWLATSST